MESRKSLKMLPRIVGRNIFISSESWFSITVSHFGKLSRIDQHLLNLLLDTDFVLHTGDIDRSFLLI